MAALRQIITLESAQTGYRDETLETQDLTRLTDIVTIDGGQIAVGSTYIHRCYIHD